jgi:hypothetical protein
MIFIQLWRYLGPWGIAVARKIFIKGEAAS